MLYRNLVLRGGGVPRLCDVKIIMLIAGKYFFILQVLYALGAHTPVFLFIRRLITSHGISNLLFNDKTSIHSYTKSI